MEHYNGRFMEVLFTTLQEEELLQQSVHNRVIEIFNRAINLKTNDDIGCLQLVYGLPGL